MKKILVLSVCSTILASSLAFSQNYSNYPIYNCSAGSNGVFISEDKSGGKSANVPGHTPQTRIGNNGGGNGGEAFDGYLSWTPEGTVVDYAICRQTESEDDDVGIVYMDFGNGSGYVQIATTREFDPGKW